MKTISIKPSIQTAYLALEKSTPLRTDCGKLCEKSCCRGFASDLGMYLFPGEEAFFKSLPKASFPSMKLKRSKFKLENGESVHLLLCPGSCPRHLRPLSCRIFPLTPYLTAGGILMVKIDPRSRRLCPLAENGSKRFLSRDFVRRVRRACKALTADEKILAYIEKLSRMLDERFFQIKYP